METEYLDLIVDRYGLTGSIEASAGPGGTAGSNLIIRAGQEKYLLRTRSSEHSSSESIDYEHSLIDAISEYGVPVAPPRKTIDGESCFFHHEKIVELLPWIDGEYHTPGDKTEIRSLGRTIAKLHLATKGRFELKHWQLREDDPNRLLEDLTNLFRRDELVSIDSIANRLVSLRDRVRKTYDSLPKAVVHGDLHPGNILFNDGRLVALLDFDWANRRERIRDISDCLIFFCSERVERINPDDIWSLTQGFKIDQHRALILISAYRELNEILGAELLELPTVLSLRWLQMRIRGGRKVDEKRRSMFLDRGNLFRVMDDFAELDFNESSRAD